MSVTTNIDVLLKNCYIYYYKYEIAVMLCVAKLFWILPILKYKNDHSVILPPFVTSKRSSCTNSTLLL